MNSLLKELLAKTPEGQREMHRARLRVAVSEELALRMQALGKTQAALAQDLGISRSAISQALCGNRNLSLNTLADMAHALNLDVKVHLRPLVAGVSQSAGAILQPDPRQGIAVFQIHADACVPYVRTTSSSAAALTS